MRLRDYKFPRTVVIKIDQKKVGICIFFEIKFGPLHFIEIQRGPLWFDHAITEYGEVNLLIQFAKKINEIYPKNIFRRRRWLPEFKNDSEVLESIKNIGFKAKTETFSTVWVDLSFSIDIIRKNLRQKWRNCLNKAEKLNLDIRFDFDMKNLNLFLLQYQKYKIQKKYVGLSPLFVKEEAKLAFQLKKCIFIWSYHDNVPIAAVMISLHGHSASYRASWNSELGRKFDSHYILIWKAINYLQSAGYHYFDLGGLLTDHAHLNHFKLGLGGKMQENIVTLS